MTARLLSVLAGVGTSVFLWLDSVDPSRRHFAAITVGALAIGFILLRALGIRA